MAWTVPHTPTLVTLYLTHGDDHLRAQIRGTSVTPPHRPMQRVIVNSSRDADALIAAFAMKRSREGTPYGGAEITAVPTCSYCGRLMVDGARDYCSLVCSIDAEGDV